MLIDSPMTVSGGIVYFGGNADDPTTHQQHHYLYALNATSGALLWQHQIDGGNSGIPSPFLVSTPQVQAYYPLTGVVAQAPQVSQNLVYILVASQPHISRYSSFYSILALDRFSGSVRWSTRYVGDLSQLSVASDGSMVYATNANLLMAFNGQNGQKQWEKQIPRSDDFAGFMALQTVNRTIYATFTHYKPVVKSIIYAFDASSGSQLWSSRQVDGAASPLVVTQNALYFGTDAGQISALSLKDGASIWSSTSRPSLPAFVSLQEEAGVIYARSTLSELNANTGEQGIKPWVKIDAFQVENGTKMWESMLPGEDIGQDQQTGLGWDGGQLVVDDGIAYVSTRGNMVCSFSTGDGLAHPMFGHEKRLRCRCCPHFTARPLRRLLVP